MLKCNTSFVLSLAILCATSDKYSPTNAAEPEFAAELIFPLNEQHNHAPGIVACPNGNIQPTVLRRNDGTLVAYMRENGPRKKIRVCESTDDGESWGRVGVCDLPNPGAGVDGLRLASGKWLLVYNDTPEGRNRLAVSLSSDEGRTWSVTRRLEDHPTGSYHYPAVTQAADGQIHIVYSYFVEGGKSMKHAAISESWVEGK